MPKMDATLQGAQVLHATGGGALRVERHRSEAGQDYVRLVPSGSFDLTAFREVITALVALDASGPPPPALWDFRGHDFGNCSAETCRSIALSLRSFPSRAGLRRGFLVDSQTGFGTLRMFQQTADAFGVEDEEHMRVDTDEPALIAWLTGQTSEG